MDLLSHCGPTHILLIIAAWIFRGALLAILVYLGWVSWFGSKFRRNKDNDHDSDL